MAQNLFHQINPATDALLVIDVQNDFCPGGRLAVANGDQIVPGIVQFAQLFDHIVLTQDWHPAGHHSFASTQNKDPFSQIDLDYGLQTLWPDHCVQGTSGAAFVDDLAPVVERAEIILRKGTNSYVDSYSAFFENNGSTTGLAEMLRARGIERIFCVGLAYDYCVAYSALDAAREGFKSVVLIDLCRAIKAPYDENITTVDWAETMFEKHHVVLGTSDHFARPSPTESVRAKM